MKELNPAHMEAVARHISRSPYFNLISMEIKELDWGRSRLEVPVQQKHLQPFRMVHGGVYSSLVDAAAFWAVYPQIDEDSGMTTVEMKLNYLAPVSDGRLIGRGRSIKAAKTLCLAEASIEDDRGKLLAHGTVTMMVRSDLALRGIDLPAKFLT